MTTNIEQRATEIDREVGARIRARRRELRMSQGRLGDRLGVTFQQVQKYERGVNRVSASSLVLTAEALDCRPQDLLGTEDRKGKVDWSRFHDHETSAALDAFGSIRSKAARSSALQVLRTLAEVRT